MTIWYWSHLPGGIIPGRGAGRHSNSVHHTNHADKRKKTAVVGVRDREAGAVRAGPVPETTAARLIAFMGSTWTPKPRNSPARAGRTAA